LKVLQVHNAYVSPGGEDTVVEQERSSLIQAGVEVRTLTTKNRPSSDALTDSLKATRVIWSTGGQAALKLAVAQFNPDVIHIHNTHYEFGPAIFWAARGTRLPVVMTAHNYRLMCSNALFLRDNRPCELCLHGAHWNAVRYKCYRNSRSASAAMAAGLLLHRRLLRTYERCVTKIICLTEFQRQKLVASGLSASQLVVKDNQVIQDPSQFGAPRNERTGTYLYTGRLSPEKGVDLLLHAWRSRTRQGTRLVIAGDGPEHQHLRSIVAGRDDVEMLGWQDQASVRALMRRADWVVLPSRWYEGSPLVLAEAHAQGTPVIVPAHGSFTTLVSEGVNGRFFGPGDASALSRVLDETSQMGPESWTRYSSGARSSAVARAESTRTSKLIGIYEASITSNTLNGWARVGQ